jgi:Zn-dependent protease with chaperone function
VNLPYFLRLVSLCLACFFVIYVGIMLATWSGLPLALRLAEGMSPRRATRFLFALRFFPTALALLLVAIVCAPSYLWLEPRDTAEHVGLAFVGLALLAAAAWCVSISRAVRALVASIRFTRHCERLGSVVQLAGVTAPVIVVEGEIPLLAMAEVFRRRIVITRGVLRALSAEQLEAALGHERAHGASRDNLKRLLLLLAPEVFPFSGRFAALDRAWSRFSEWAADDDAIEQDGRRSLPLAEALVRFAKMGTALQLSPLLTALVPADQDLSIRVARLLQAVPPQEKRGSRLFPLVCGSGVLCMAGLLAVAMLRPSTLYSVHSLLERLVR